MRMELSSVRKKKETTQCDKRTVICDVGTTQCEDKTVKYKKKKSKGITKCEKKIVTCDVGVAQCEDGTVKCEKKVREPPKVTKELAYVMLEPHNMRMKLSNVRKKNYHM